MHITNQNFCNSLHLARRLILKKHFKKNIAIVFFKIMRGNRCAIFGEARYKNVIDGAIMRILFSNSTGYKLRYKSIRSRTRKCIGGQLLQFIRTRMRWMQIDGCKLPR